MIKTFPPHTAQKPLTNGIGPWRTIWGAHHLLIYTEEADVPAYAAVAVRYPQLLTSIETSPDGFCRAILDADLVCMARKYDKRWLLNAPRLRWLHVGGTGIDRLYPLEELPADLVISNTSGLNAEMVADYCVCVLLMLTWNFPRLWRNQMTAVWERWGVERVEGKILTLVGLGNIGRAVVQRAAVLGLGIRGIKRTPAPVPGVEHVVGLDQLLPVLHESDYVVLAVPLTVETRGLIGRRELEAMPPSSYLINISRGAVIQEQALVGALKERMIAGAALDVFETEPLPPESELWTLENVILTPHLSSWSRDYRLRSAEIFGVNLERYLAGQPLLHVVDRTQVIDRIAIVDGAASRRERGLVVRPNRLKHALQAGGVQFGTFVTSSDPQIVEAIGYAGWDFAILDMEHTAIDYGHLPALCAAAENAGMTPLVRVGSCEPNPILRVLDSGAFGVITPHVCSKEDAAALVAACRYPPLGIRGVNGGTRAAGYGQANFVEHARQSNEEILTIALIEDAKAVEAIEEIVQVPGLDVVFPGAGDLSASLGLLGQAAHPTVQEKVNRVVRAVQARPPLYLAYHIMDAQQITRYRDMGAQLVVFSQDSRMVMQVYRGVLAQMRATG